MFLFIYLRLGPAASCGSLDHLDSNGGPDSLSQESQDIFHYALYDHY